MTYPATPTVVLERTIAEHKNAPRVWLDGPVLAKAGFAKGQTYEPTLSQHGLVLRLDPLGTRVVSAKVSRTGVEIPVMDLNSHKVLGMFAGQSTVKVLISEGEIQLLPVQTHTRIEARLAAFRELMAAGQALPIGSVAHGIGTLSRAIHEGLALEGLRSRLAFAIEIDDDLLQHAAQKNPVWDDQTLFVGASLQNVVFDDQLRATLPRSLFCLEAGIPCSGASVAGRAKRKLQLPEDHPLVGSFVVPLLALIAHCNPLTISLECVVPYLSTASASLLRAILGDLGYDVHETVIHAEEFGAMEGRKRMAMVAVTKGIPFSFQQLVKPPIKHHSLGDYLEDIPLSDPRWRPMEGLKAHAERHREAGNGFAMQVFYPEDTRVGTITAQYARVRPTDPRLGNHERPELLRQFTSLEHARIKGQWPEMLEGVCETDAHRYAGQGVCPGGFRDGVATLLARAVRQYHEGRAQSLVCSVEVVTQDAQGEVETEAGIAALDIDTGHLSLCRYEGLGARSIHIDADGKVRVRYLGQEVLLAVRSIEVDARPDGVAQSLWVDVTAIPEDWDTRASTTTQEAPQADLFGSAANQAIRSTTRVAA